MLTLAADRAQAARRSAAAAVAGYVHLRTTSGAMKNPVPDAIAPLVERIERLEKRVGTGVPTQTP